MKQITVKSNIDSFDELNSFIESSISSNEAHPGLKNACLLCSEELFLKIISCTDENSELNVTISKDISGTSTIKYSFFGKPFELSDSKNDDIGLTVLKYYSDKIKYKYKDGFNSVTLQVGIEHTRTNIYSLIAVAFSVIFYTLLRKIVSEDAADYVIDGILWPIVEIYIKSILLFAPLLLFFSVIVSITKYYSTIERFPSSWMLIIHYFISSLIAIIVGIISSVIVMRFIPVLTSLSSYLDSSGAIQFSEDVLSNILLVLPENVISPFITFNSLQLILLALITGLALGSLGNRTDNLKDLAENITDLFGKIISIVYSFSPLVIFAICVFGLDRLKFAVIPTFAAIFVIALIVLLIQVVYYCLLLKIYGINPVYFFRTSLPMIKETYRIGSTSNAVPLTIAGCERRFHIPKKFLNVSIPLGATNNLDGTCICLTLLSLLIIHIVGGELSAKNIIALGLTAYIMSLGIPTQCGSFVISASVLLSMFGIEGYIIAIPLIFEVFMSQILAAFNLIGDIVFTNIVFSKIEKLAD